VRREGNPVAKIRKAKNQNESLPPFLVPVVFLGSVLYALIRVIAKVIAWWSRLQPLCRENASRAICNGAVSVLIARPTGELLTLSTAAWAWNGEAVAPVTAA